MVTIRIDLATQGSNGLAWHEDGRVNWLLGPFAGTNGDQLNVSATVFGALQNRLAVARQRKFEIKPAIRTAHISPNRGLAIGLLECGIKCNGQMRGVRRAISDQGRRGTATNSADIVFVFGSATLG